MTLPNSYTVKPGSVPAYFDAMLNAEVPERFSTRFLENLGFKSTNDRLFIGVLKDLGFLDTDGIPTERYYQFLDRSQSTRVVAQGIREAYGDLFKINVNAHMLSADEVKNKLRTLYKGEKKDNVIGRIASTFAALCEFADFEGSPITSSVETTLSQTRQDGESSVPVPDADEKKPKPPSRSSAASGGGGGGTSVSLDSLQYHINIVLPDTRDQAVYDAIFKSIRDHLG